MKFILPSFILTSLLFSSTMMIAQDDLDSLSNEWNIQLDDVVVTGQYTPTDTRNVLYEIKVLKQAEIAARNATNLEELLVQETGIRISQDLILGSALSIQGLSGENVKIMIDGVPIIGRLGGNLDLSQISLNNVERIEIIEGPMAVNYGTNALAGVINIITKKSQKKKYTLGLSSSIESIGIQEYNFDFGVRSKQNLTFKMNGSWYRFEGIADSLPETGNASRDLLWNPKTNWNLNTLLAYRFNEHHKVSFNLNYFDEIILNDGAIKRPQYQPYAYDDRYKTRRLNPYLNYEGTINDKFYLQSLLSINRYKRVKNSYRSYFSTDTSYQADGSHQLDFTTDSSILIAPVFIGDVVINNQDTSTFNEIIFRSNFAYEFPQPNLSVQAGLDFTYDNATGKRIQDKNESKANFSQLGDYGIFGKVKYQPLKKLSTEIGLRYAYNSKYNAPLIPSIHLKYDMHKDWVLKASYGKGFRAPSLKELYFRFIDSNHFIIGNNELQAEKSDHLQSSLTYSFRKKKHILELKNKLFYNYVSNRISLYEFEPNPDQPTPEAEYTYFNQNIFKTIGHQIHAKYNYKTYQLTSSFATTGYYNPLSETYAEVNTFSHAIECSFGFSYNNPKHHWNIGLFWKYNDRLISYFPDVDENGEDIVQQQIINGFSIIDLNTSKSMLKNRLNLSLGIQNLFNKTSVNQTAGLATAHGNSGTTSIVNMGRNFIVRLQFNLDYQP